MEKFDFQAEKVRHEKWNYESVWWKIDLNHDILL